MAIKIIKNTMKEPIEMKCENCKSVFEYNYQDIQLRKRYNLFNIEILCDRVVRCPVCKYDNVLINPVPQYNVKAEITGNIAQDH